LYGKGLFYNDKKKAEHIVPPFYMI